LTSYLPHTTAPVKSEKEIRVINTNAALLGRYKVHI